MNLEKLKQKLKPSLVPFTILDETIYIHRPAASDLQKCDSVASTLIYCVKDENGDQIFSDEDIDGRINVGSIDFAYQKQIYDAISKLAEAADSISEIEKSN
jgi:hypothetical protein